MIEEVDNVRARGRRSQSDDPQRYLTAMPVRSAPLAEWTIADQAAWARRSVTAS
jgi:hypothetical protein